MENFTNKSPGSVDPDQFQEDGNDSDLEARLYAEIYYSNEIHDPGEDFQDSIKTIQDIKNASQASKLIQNNQLELENVDDPSNSSEKNCFPRNGQTNLVSTEKGEISRHIDKNLNLETLSNNFPRDDSNKIFVENINPQENPNKNCTPKQKTPKQKKKETPAKMNEEIQNSTSSPRCEQEQKKTDESPQIGNNSLTTSMTRKRTSKMYKNLENKSKRRSLESDKSVPINTPKSVKEQSGGVMLMPVLLNDRKSSDENNVYPLISPATMELLFPSKSKESKSEVKKKKKGGIKKKIKASNLKGNSKLSKKAYKTTNEDEILEVISSDSSNEALSIVETPKAEKQKQSKKLKKEMPRWLDISSDSGESILEVPVPPKPPPPLIDLNDSEGISSDSDRTSSDGIYDLNSKSETRDVVTVSTTSSTSNYNESSKDNSKISKENDKVIFMDNSSGNSVEISVVDSVESSEENLRSQLPSEQSNLIEDTDSSYSDFPVDERMDSIGENLILNCTEVQKGAKNLEQIKKLRKDVPAEVEGSVDESTSEYNEYIEPLNDLVKPSTSKASESFAKNKSHKKKSSEQNRKSSKEQTDEEYFFERMPNKIKAFYNNSWGGEEFSVEDTQSQMRKDPRCWAILDEDWKPNLKRQRYFLNKTKCSLCRQPGHLRANCPEPKKSPLCHMCGSQGHYETRCPHKVCLTCGTKQNTFRQTCESCRKLSCTLCRSRGHKKDFCPDLWRQYHHTTSEAEHQPPKNSSEVMKPSNSLFCCNCTMRGHESSTCNKYRWSQHYPTPSHITSYYKCNKMLPISNSVEVVNLANSPGESSRNTTNDIDLETLSNEEMPETSENDNSIMSASNSKALSGKILFEARANSRKNAKKLKNLKKYKDRIVLSDVQGANLEGLIAGTFIPKGLEKVSRIMNCDICIRLIGTKVVMLITYYPFLAKRSFFTKFISFWVRLSDEEKRKLKYVIPRQKQKLIFRLDATFKKFDNLSGDIKLLWEEIETLTNELKEEKTNLSKKEKRQLSFRIDLRDNKLRKIVQLLYKNDCSVEKEALSNLRKLHADLHKHKHMSLEVYIQIFYYYCLIFGRYRPPNLEEMIQKYLALHEGSVDRSINNSVSSENSVVNVENSYDEDLDNHQNFDQEDNNQERQNLVPQRNFKQNRPSPSIPSLLEINPPRFYNREQSTSSTGNHNTLQTRNRQSNQFEFPADDFIPISNYHPSEFLEPSPQFNRWRDARQYARNPMHNFRTFNPRAPQTSQRLVDEASYLLNMAHRLNMTQLTKARIQLVELINQNRLQRKHINHFRYLINSEHARGFR